MCGRFALFTPPARMARYFGASLAEGTDPEQHPSWNVAPTDEVLGVRDRPPPSSGEEPGTAGAPETRAPAPMPAPVPERLLMSFRWGLIPWWSKDTSSGSRLFNARAETVATKASFREAFRERRIIVPADGFYEWHMTTTGTASSRTTSARADGEPLAFAGLAERWRPKDSPPGTPYLRSCTVITTTAGADMEGIHDRMPVILDPATFDLWLDPVNEDTEELRALLLPPPPGTVLHHPVGRQVGNVRNNDPSLIEPA